MKRLVKHIEYLLITHDCVIIPGLGALIASSKPAYIDFANQRIVPPSRSVIFNQAVTNDDGLLANSFSRKYALSFEEARQVIIKEVEDLKSLLNAGSQVQIGRIGFLSLSEESKLLFTPCIDLFREDLTGYCDIKINKLISGAKDKVELTGSVDCRAEIKTDSSIINGDDIEATKKYSFIKESPEEVPSDDSDDNERKYYLIKIRRSVVKYAALLIITISIVLAVLFNPVPYDSREQRASVVPVESIINHIPEKSVDVPSVSTEQIESTETLPEEDNKTLLSESLTDNQSSTYFLIVGTFHNKSEAEKFVSMTHSEEFPLFTVASKKVTRVATAQSDNREDLQHLLNSTSLRNKFPNAWIWSR